MPVPLHCCSGTAVELRTDKNPPEFAEKTTLVKHEHEAERYAGCQTQQFPRAEIELCIIVAKTLRW